MNTQYGRGTWSPGGQGAVHEGNYFSTRTCLSSINPLTYHPELHRPVHEHLTMEQS